MYYYNHRLPTHSGGPSPEQRGWLYLCYDYSRIFETKIGVTAGTLFGRVNSSTENYRYVIFCAFHLPFSLRELKKIESYVSRTIRALNLRRPTGRKSEYWDISPPDAMSIILERLPNCAELARDDGLETDYTNVLYLPRVHPHHTSGAINNFENLVRMAAPEEYINYLRSGRFIWDKSEDFIKDYGNLPSRSPLCICGPQILQNRVNYDILCREYFGYDSFLEEFLP